ncbi:MAG: anti-sigma factor [Actinobacteria bacterium]|nr:anti-sigma factor [Actinomycetota bacterium]
MTNDLHHLAAAYALDALDDTERDDFETHYPTCSICSQEVADFHVTASVLAGSAASDAPEHLRTGVLTAIAEVRQVAPIVAPNQDNSAVTNDVADLARHRQRDQRLGRRSQWLLPLMASAAAVVVAVLTTVAILDSRTAPDSFAEVLAAPDAIVTTVVGEAGALQVVWSRDQDRVAVFGNNVADLDPETTFELWFVLDDGSVAKAGLFQSSDGVVRKTWMTEDHDAVGFGVTVEPAGGSAQPTSDIIYLGDVAQTTN